MQINCLLKLYEAVAYFDNICKKTWKSLTINTYLNYSTHTSFCVLPIVQQLRPPIWRKELSSAPTKRLALKIFIVSPLYIVNIRDRSVNSRKITLLYWTYSVWHLIVQTSIWKFFFSLPKFQTKFHWVSNQISSNF